ncbi:hypothetical protein OXIME_000441 [Oxyplasma meridianum]|uniref:Polymer-forming cytoskeletal protein n=1 Tax=Oxyplasma meridianum TaxID=3073602 RepID=A0AAX4NGD1_9ARCH
MVHISGSAEVGGDVISSHTIDVSGSMKFVGKILGKSVYLHHGHCTLSTFSAVIYIVQGLSES